MKFNNLCKGLFSFTLALSLISGEQRSNAQSGSIIQLQSKTGACLDANTGQAGKVPYMRPCDNGQNKNLHWVPVKATSDSYFIKASVSGLCLDANTGQPGRNVYLRTCDASNKNLLWYNASFSSLPIGQAQRRTRTTGACLDANAGVTGRSAYMRACDSGQNNSLIWVWREIK